MGLLLLGSEDAFRDEVSKRLINGRDFTILARTTSLLQGIDCLESKAVDVVLVSPEFSDEELSLFTFDARRCGFSGLILRVAARPEEPSSPEIQTDRPIQVGDFFLEMDSRRIWVRGSEVHCWAQEFDLLHFFCKHPEQLLSYQALIDAVWREPTGSRRMLKELIRDLRAKIEITSTPQYIVQHRLFGYRFIPSPSQES
jgi:DNA-binding response OmpR family regulator